jgi:GNAT superfamily N-acetyltransferase
MLLQTTFLGETFAVMIRSLTLDDMPQIDALAQASLQEGFQFAAEARRHGFGRRLLASLEARAWPAYSSLRLRTDTERAAAFYEALGYSRSEEPGATHRRTLPMRAGVQDTGGVR